MRKIILLFVLAFVAVVASAQKTSLVVDNQTPGWLSSKINYGDQKTLVNLTVTGYVNQTDIDFINQLIEEQSLHGRLDLSDVEIVGKSRDYDNTMTGYNRGDICCIKGWLKHLLLPLKLKKANWACCYAYCDTISLGSTEMTKIISDMFFCGRNSNFTSSYGRIKCLIFREGVDIIGETTNTITTGGPFDLPNLEEIKLPSSLKAIKPYAFANCTKLKCVSFFDHIQEIGNRAFWQVPAFRDMVKLPHNLNVYNVGSFENGRLYYNSTFYQWETDVKIYNKQVIYVPESVSQINFEDIKYIDDSICYMHINRMLPPEVLNSPYRGNKNVNVFVPKKALSAYLNDEKWAAFTLFPEPNPATKVTISSHELSLQKGYTKLLAAMILPDDADSQDIIWNVKDERIAKVSQEGIVTGINTGETFIYATLKDNPVLKDSCFIKVFQPVTSISLNLTEKEIKVGEDFNLIANISPDDADNKNILWNSENDLIATVEAGNVIGKKAGKVKVTATSESDNAISSSCLVTVLQPVEGISLDKSFMELDDIGESSQLSATVIPDDASNNSINWKSSDEKVCIVSNGKVVAVGYGTAVVIATTVDGGHMATCTVTVKNMTGIEDVQEDKTVKYSIFTVDGKRIENLQKGINIIKFNNGQIRKVTVK